MKSKAYYYLGALLVSIALIILVSFLTFETLYGQLGQVYVIGLVVFSLLVFAASFLITYRNLKRGEQARMETRTLSILRFVLSTVMLGYAFTKLHNGHMYQSYFSLDNRMNDLNDFDTVWSFYGRFSALQTLIGLLELLPSVLLLFRRTTFLGAVLMFPVISNVVILNIFYEIGGLTLPLSFLLTVFDIYILFSYKVPILEFLRKVSHPPAEQTERSAGRKVLGILKFLPLVFLGTLTLIKTIRPKQEQAIHGAYQLVELKQNEHLIHNDSLPVDAFKKIYFEKRHIQNSLITKNGTQGAKITFPTKDSITIAYRNGPLDVYVMEDTATMFKGHFELSHDTLLLISGIQNKQHITARYKKIPLREYAYWWE
jgi:hypothetical protein